jgi:hypothetical protein
MPKRKTNTTADLIVRHVHRHLTREVKSATPQFPKLNFKGLKQFEISSTALFAFAGIIILTIAFQLVKLSFNTESSVFIAKDAEDYAAQTAFYTGEKVAAEPMHAAAEESRAEPSQAASVFGFVLVAALFWHLHREYGLFATGPHFRIRRIR